MRLHCRPERPRLSSRLADQLMAVSCPSSPNSGGRAPKSLSGTLFRRPKAAHQFSRPMRVNLGSFSAFHVRHSRLCHRNLKTFSTMSFMCAPHARTRRRAAMQHSSRAASKALVSNVCRDRNGNCSGNAAREAERGGPTIFPRRGMMRARRLAWRSRNRL
jgi:hypothetical protein